MSDKSRRKMFLYRSHELLTIRKMLKELLADHAIERPIRYYYGVPNVGKTSLMNEIKSLALEEFTIPTAYVDFDVTKSSKKKTTKITDLRINQDLFEIVETIKSQLGIGSFNMAIEFDEENYIRSFLDDLRKSRGTVRKPVLLLFDTLEDVNVEAFDKLQSSVLIPLVDDRDTLIIFTARAQIRELPISFGWSIRRQLKTYQLRPFTFDETVFHFERLLKEGRQISLRSLKEYYKYTNGIPGLNEYIADNIDEQNSGLIHKVVENAVLERAPKAREHLDILKVVAVCRLFDTELLAYLVKNLPLHIPENVEAHLGTTLLIQLLETTLIEHRADETGYVVVEDIHSLMYEYAKASDPQRVLAVHNLAFQWFKEQVSKGDIVLLADVIYHQAGAWFNEKALGEYQQPNLELHDQLMEVDKLETILRFNLETLKDNNRSSMLVKRIKEQLLGSEFRWFLNENQIHALINVCNDFEESTAVSVER